MRLPGEEHPLVDAEDVRDRLEHQVDLVVDGGRRGVVPTTVVDLTGVAVQDIAIASAVHREISG